MAQSQFDYELALATEQNIIAGHTGIPFTKKIGNRRWHNSGAVGMPANDGTARTWFSVLKGGVFFHSALQYNFEATIAKMHQANLALGYEQCLSSGLWPSVDVLPALERKVSGQAIQLTMS